MIEITYFCICTMHCFFWVGVIGPKYALFSKIGSKFAFCSKIDSKFIVTFCSKIGPKISNIMSMVDGLNLSRFLEKVLFLLALWHNHNTITGKPMEDWRNAMVPLVFEYKSSACLVLPPGFKKSLAYLLCNTAMSSMKHHRVYESFSCGDQD